MTQPHSENTHRMEGEGDKKNEKKVCVTGGTGFLASWLIMKLLHHGYSVNTTIRPPSPGSKKDTSYLTNLPSAPHRLQVFTADFDNPESFEAAIKGCIGVFHVAHPTDYNSKETEEMIANKSVRTMLSILKACLNSKTVKRVVYTSSGSTVMFADKGSDVLDESSWSDVDFIRNSNMFGASYCISKTLAERAALEFAEKHSLDVVIVIPTMILGPFICPTCPGSVKTSLDMFIGDKKQIQYYQNTPFVHTDDVASAHIFLFQHPEAKGRYICSGIEVDLDKLCKFLSKRYPQFEIPSADCLSDGAVKLKSLSSKKLLGTGFRYKYGLEEMFDQAIECCKQKGFL